MLQQKLSDKNIKWYIIGIYVLFVAVQTSCLQYIGDDYWWLQLSSVWEVWTESSPNGRYFTNMITYFMMKFPVLRWCIYFSGVLLLFYLAAWILRKNTLCDWKAYAVSSIAMLFLPFQIMTNTINWISGFPNYILSACLVLLYLCFCQPLFSGKELPAWKGSSIGLLVLGFLSTLCVENITIYVLVLAVFVIAFSIIRLKKVHIGAVAYLIGAVAGTILMFSDKNYHSVIVEANDNKGYRFVEISMIDIIMKIYNQIILDYVKPFYLWHLLLAFCLLKLYLKKYLNAPTPKYAAPCMGVVLIFANYSLFTQNVTDFNVTTLNYLIRAIETAFTFIYLICLVYLFYQLLPKETFAKSMFFLVSHLITIAPFLLVNPVTGRCFFAEYLFWVLMTGTVASAVPESEFSKEQMKKILVTAGVFFSCIVFAFMHISNKYCDIIRIRYLKEQLKTNKPITFLVNLPYPQLTMDLISLVEYTEKNLMLRGEKVSYADLFMKCYDLPPETSERRFDYISLYYYHLSVIPEEWETVQVQQEESDQ